MLDAFVHTELVQVFYDIKWISSGAFEFEKTPTNIPKNHSRHTQKIGMLNVIKQSQH